MYIGKYSSFSWIISDLKALLVKIDIPQQTNTCDFSHKIHEVFDQHFRGPSTKKNEFWEIFHQTFFSRKKTFKKKRYISHKYHLELNKKTTKSTHVLSFPNSKVELKSALFRLVMAHMSAKSIKENSWRF